MYSTIIDHPNYEVSMDGEVRKKGSDKVLETYSVFGHPKVILDGETKYVSRLVAETFLQKNAKAKHVKHIDGDKLNNKVSNLEWSTKSDIQQASYDYFGALAPGGNEKAKEIVVVETGEIFPSIRSCARALHVSPSGIRSCLRGDLKSLKGYTFILKKDV